MNETTKFTQNMLMQKVFYVFLSLIAATTFACVLPYPIFSGHTNITESVAYDINNHAETEFKNISASSPKVLPLSFTEVDALVLVGDRFDILDMQTKCTISVVRVGGQNHIDIQPADSQNAQALFALNEGWTWQRRPVLVKLSENAYVAASLAPYPHGYNSINTLSGHMCLHFLGSKTDGTAKQDYHHQKCVTYALSHGQQLINSLDN